MIAVIIIIIAAVVIIACISNGQWGAAGLTAVIGLVLLMMGAGERKDTRAWINRRNYWASGGPDRPESERAAARRYYARGMTRTDLYVEDDHISSRDLRKAKAKRERFKEELASGEATIGKAPSRVCHYCGRFVYARGRMVQTDMGAAIEYSCPRCGRVNRTKLWT